MQTKNSLNVNSMRLFISINPDETARKRIADIVQQLKKVAFSGNFTRAENLHLTLAFIGETDSSLLPKIRETMDLVTVKPFMLSFSGAGSFRSRNGRNRKPGDIWWIGIEESPALIRLQRQLANGLRRSGFPMENRIYTPHLTIGRSVQIPGSPQSDNPQYDRIHLEYDRFDSEVSQISLMHSHRVDNQLTYTEIYKKQL